MTKKIITIIIVLLLIAGAAFCGYHYATHNGIKGVQEEEIVIDPPIVTFAPVFETPTATATPVPGQFQNTNVYQPQSTIDPYWIPGPWGDYHH